MYIYASPIPSCLQWNVHVPPNFYALASRASSLIHRINTRWSIARCGGLNVKILMCVAICGIIRHWILNHDLFGFYVLFLHYSFLRIPAWRGKFGETIICFATYIAVDLYVHCPIIDHTHMQLDLERDLPRSSASFCTQPSRWLKFAVIWGSASSLSIDNIRVQPQPAWPTALRCAPTYSRTFTMVTTVIIGKCRWQYLLSFQKSSWRSLGKIWTRIWWNVRRRQDVRVQLDSMVSRKIYIYLRLFTQFNVDDYLGTW